MPFVKGRSGNPKGAPKKTEVGILEVREFARAKSVEAIETIYRLLKSEDEKIALLAANSILDRALGKPAQAVEISGNKDRPLRAVFIEYTGTRPTKADLTDA